jgi:D-3-phosphoglycerate dehydrogenase
MFNIRTFNKISNDGLDILRMKGFEVSETFLSPDAIVLRSYNLFNENFTDSLKAIGRAGAGVNNIPVDECTKRGIVVFNAPGANANAVKELVISGLLLSSRDIVEGINFVNSLNKNKDDIHDLVEKNKSKFKGIELNGKKIGVIGLGAIGVMVANAADNLGMKVYGYDPFISINRAWGLSSKVINSSNLNNLLSEVDFVTFHMPLTDSTRSFVNKDRLSKLKKGSIVLNFSRPEIVDEDAIIESLDDNIIAKYVCDFPSNKLHGHNKIISIPHLGASTREAEDNCAVMVANQISDYLLNGNIENSVNFPSCYLERSGDFRIVIINNNIPNMVSQITTVLGKLKLNISEMLNKSKNDIAYTLVDISGEKFSSLESELRCIEGIKSVRII